ncbi:pyrimidine/purine nucleoside phosphorylase [Alphaproteobacteria bacterium]|nr:pyrimidine/purine nucleoside phosphorylase [Alphaproteobacteria bacterium]
MNEFKNVDVKTIANIYFDGKVISRNISFNDGSIKTLGVMLPGNYEFSTQKKEYMEIFSGELELQLENSSNWKTVKQEMAFYIQKNSSFKVKVKSLVNYCCSYLDE